MTMTTGSVPYLKEPVVAEAKKSTTPQPEPVPEPAAPALAPAGASGDPAVQWLLAERLSHVSNGNAERVAEMDRRLADLGFTAQ